MIRIHVRPQLRNLAVAAMAVGSIVHTGCAAETGDEETGELEDGLTTAPGRGVVRLQAFSFGYQSTTGGDEFIRTGSRLVAELSFDELTYTFDYPERENLTPSNVGVTARITWLDAAGGTKRTLDVPVRWSTGTTGVVGATASFVVPKATAAFSLDFVVESGGKTFLISERIQAPRTFPIFGFELPNKVALFDNGPVGPRTRIIEGGNLVAGSTARLSMLDWRADAIVDRSRLDAVYGRRMAGSRFGSVVVDAVAPIEYEVGVAYTADGINWSGSPLLATPNARVLQTQSDPRRVAFEGSIALPRTSRELRMAFHVRAFLVVPNFGPEVFDARYAPGARVLLADRWDNSGGADYRLPVSRR